MKRVAFLFVALFGILSFPSLSVAQPDPDAKFKKGGVVPGLGVISLDWAPASWSHSDSTSTYSAQISGSAGSNSASYTTSIQRFNDTGIVQTRHYIEVWIRSSATAHVTYSETATVNSSGVNGVASYGPLFSDNGNTFSRSGGASDVYSGSATVTYNADFADCGAGGYRRVVGSPLQLIASTTGGNNSPSSVATVDISVSLGTDTPVAVATGPFVSGILTPNPSVGDTLLIQNNSHDPDNNAGSSGRPGICGASWVVTKPNGSVVNGSSVASISFAADIAGPYNVLLTVTDDEGVQAQTSLGFDVDPRSPRSGSPGEEPTSCRNCGDSKVQACTFASRGNNQISWRDPVATRGYPLRNRIFINSQSLFPTRTTDLGNASFSYGIEILTATINGTPRRFVIDGNGTELDFGPTSGAPTGEPGVFSVLTVNQNSYTLSGAGAPESIHEAGNFTYEFNSNGQLTSLTDPSGNTQALTYNSAGDLSLVTDLSSGRILTFEYDTPGQVARIVENGGVAITHLTYSSNRLTNINLKNSSAVTIRSLAVNYNSDGTMANVVRDGDSASTITYSYVPSGNGFSLGNMSWTGGGTNFSYFNAPGAGATYRVNQTNALGGVTSHDFERDGDLKRVVMPNFNGGSGSVTYTYAHDSARNRTSWSNGLNSWTATYNALGLMASLQDTAGGSWSYTYSGVDLTNVSDITGTLWTLSYTDSNNPHSPTTLTNAVSKTWNLSYNQTGQILTVTPPTGSPTGADSYTYEENVISPNFGYLKTITNGAGNLTQFNSYTAMGDVTSLSTFPATGVTNTFQFTYDAAQRLTQFRHPDNKLYTLNYTGRDLTSTADEAGTLNQLDYCAVCGKQTSWDGPLTKALDWGLDGDHDLTSFTDARTNTTNYVYSAAKAVTRVGHPTAINYDFLYDTRGRLSVFENGRNQDHIFSYDGADRISSINLPAPDPDQTYTWNPDGTLQQMTDNGGTTSYTYRPNKYLQQVTYNYALSGLTPAQTVEYSYNNDDTLNTTTWKSAGVTVAYWSYSYDGAGRMSSVSNSFGEVTSYSYDGEGKLLQTSHANGTQQRYSYNQARGWPTSISCRPCLLAMSMSEGGEESPMESSGPPWHQDICDPPFASWNLTYDTGANTVGNLTRVTEQDGSIVNYGYDALYRLTSEARTGVGPYSVTYGYDLANNVTTRNGTAFGVYNTANTMTSVSGVALDKDADGNQEEVKGNGIPFNIDPILFDSRNKVRSAVYNGATYRFLTDAAGRRTKRCTTSNCNVQGTGDRYYIFSGDKVIGEVVNGVPEVAYTWGADGIASRKLLTGLQNSRYYCFGPQGETRYLTDEFQTVSSTYRYEAYGKTLNATGSDYNPFRYGGKFGYYSDQNLPLMLAGARWYSPHLLRWLSFDPISYEGGDNLYAYVMGNPVKYVDLDGLQAVPLPATPLPPPGMVGPGTVGPSLGQVGDDLTKKAQELFDRLTDPRIPYWMQPFFQEDSDPTSPPVLPPPVCKDPVVGKSGKERASDVPSWAEGFRPYLGESGKEFAKRLLDGKYGPGKHRKGPGSEFDKIRKWGDRGFK